MRRVISEILEVAIFVDLDKLCLLSKLIDRELSDDGTQPSAKASATAIIRELTFLIAPGVSSQAIELRPDRAREVVGILYIRTDLPRRALYCRVKARDELRPGRLVAALAGEDQAQIVDANSRDEFSDLYVIYRGCIFQQIFFEGQGHARAHVFAREATRIVGSRDQVSNRLVDRCIVLFREQTHLKW